MDRDEELDKELQFHIDTETDDLVASGMTREEARRRTLLEFGGVARAKEAVRDQYLRRVADGLLRDMKVAVRTLRATPLVSAVAMLSLTLGIGANTAMFSIVDSLVLRALPVREPHQLATLSNGLGPTSTWSYAIWSEIQRRADLFEGALAWSSLRFNLAQAGEMQPVSGLIVSGDFFKTLGVSPSVGRTLTAGDDTPGGGSEGPVAVISHTFWQRHFAGALDVIGRTLVIERVPFTIVGVTPERFFGPEVGRSFEVAVPIGCEPLIRGKDTALDIPTNFWLNVMIRLRPDQSMEAATSTLRALQPDIRAAAMPPNLPARLAPEFMKSPFSLETAAGGTSALRQRYTQALLTILVVVGVVLLIACANIANLQLARTAARRHELSVRVALGASRSQLARQLLVESLLIALTGAVSGLVLALWANRLLVGLLSNSVNTVSLDLSINWRVLAFTMIVTATTALLCGALPALRASAASPSHALKEHGRASDGSTPRTASALVVAQVALSLVLVVAAGLFIRTFVGLTTRPLGFDSERVVVVNVNASRAQIDPTSRIPFYYELVDVVASVPDVAAAGASVITPVSGGGFNSFIEVPGAPQMADSDRTSLAQWVTPGWFATYGTAIHVGRDITNRDDKAAVPVALVNEAFARKFLPGRDPMDATVKIVSGRGEDQVPKRIVGVVADAVYRSLRDPASPTLYVPLAQGSFPFPLTGISIGARVTAGSPMRLARSVTASLAARDPDLVFNFRSLAEQVNASVAQEQIIALLAGFFGLLALFLAGLGLYGTTAYAVATRRSEIGIRMALGAEPAAVIRLVLTRVAWQVAAGVALGAVACAWATRLVATLLYGLEPNDPATLVGSTVTLVAIGLIAGWLPAYRASQTDAAAVLKKS